MGREGYILKFDIARNAFAKRQRLTGNELRLRILCTAVIKRAFLDLVYSLARIRVFTKPIEEMNRYEKKYYMTCLRYISGHFRVDDDRKLQEDPEIWVSKLLREKMENSVNICRKVVMETEDFFRSEHYLMFAERADGEIYISAARKVVDEYFQGKRPQLNVAESFAEESVV